MEFFRTIKFKTEAKLIQDKLTIENLESISNEIFVIGEQSIKKASIGGIWGEFTLTRSLINGGIRFALVECPNALTWTVTTGNPPNADVVVLHLTINRQEQKDAFVEEIEAFLQDQCACIYDFFNSEFILN